VETAITLNNLGVLLGHMGRFEDAEEVLAEAVSIRMDLFGTEHR
jgi:Flp pilus assembly protein TadD